MIYKMMKKAYERAVCHRCDENGAVFYFSHEDFSGLMREAYAFPSSMGHTLQGYFYHYDAPVSGRIVIFEHGMGSGHRGYMKEIELLCRHGYLVLAYDHTGCMESGGDDIGGFTQSLVDLNDAISALKADPRFADASFSVVGHSWGGFSTLNIAAFHPDVTHLVAMSGFVSAERVMEQFFHGILSFVGKRLCADERAVRPAAASCDAVTSLSATDAAVLILHSKDDPDVSFEKHFSYMRDALSERENIRFVELDGKAHNPSYTEDAVKYKDAFFADYKRRMKKGKLKTAEEKAAFVASYDFDRMTAQDEAVWALIFETLDK